MKLSLLSVAAASLAVSSVAAMAADLPARNLSPVAPVVAPPAFTWTGLYVGVNGGYGVSAQGSKRDVGGHTAPHASHSFGGSRPGGFVGGAQLGYNQQIGALVLGAETDINYVGIHGGHRSHGPGAFGQPSRNQLSWFGTVRGRLGVTPTERMMVYATGGLAYGLVRDKADHPSTAVGILTRDTVRTGWTLGGGVEYALTDNLTLRGEYDYVSLGGGRKSRVAPHQPVVQSAAYAHGRRDNGAAHIVRVGLNYKF